MINTMIKQLWLLAFTLVFSCFAHNEVQAVASHHINQVDSSSSVKPNEQIKHARNETDLGSVARGIGVNLDKVLELLESSDEHEQSQALSMVFWLVVHADTDAASSEMLQELVGEICLNKATDEAFAETLSQESPATQKEVKEQMLLCWGAWEDSAFTAAQEQTTIKELQENLKREYPKVGALLEKIPHALRETDLERIAKELGIDLDEVIGLLESPDERKKLQALSLLFRVSTQIPCTDDAAAWMLTRLLGELCFRVVKDEVFAQALEQAPEKTKQAVNQFLLLYWGAEDGPKLSVEEKQKYTKEIHENITAKYPKVGALLEDISHPH